MLRCTTTLVVVWSSIVLFSSIAYSLKLPVEFQDPSTPSSPSGPKYMTEVNTGELGDPLDPKWIEKLSNVTNGLPVLFESGEILRVTGDIIIASDRTQRLARLNYLFPGIFWDKAYPDEQIDSCSFEELNILEMATRTAVRLTQYSPPHSQDAAFLRYFMTDGKVSGRWSTHFKGHYANLLHNLKQVALFPSTGPGAHRMSQRYRIGFTCGPTEGVRDHCVDSEGLPTNVNAYTVGSGKDGPGLYGTVVIFCPSFFRLRFTDMVTSGIRKTVQDLGDVSLMTFEQTIMHEWMHCRSPLGLTEKVIDIDANNPLKAVYGSERCHERAWLNWRSSNEPNPEIVLNDNYAWTWMAREFEKVWGWKDLAPSAAKLSTPTYTTSDIWTNLTSPREVPINCIGEAPNIDCSYIGMAYDDYLLDKGVACNCSGIFCTSNSPDCCGSYSCSTCDDLRFELGNPDLVPSCCAPNTCLWELGSNVKGPIS